MKMNGDKNERIKKDLVRLSDMFSAFFMNGCKVEDVTIFSRKNRHPATASRVAEALQRLSDEGEGILHFRYFVIGVRRIVKHSDSPEGNIQPIRDSFIFLRLEKRYSDILSELFQEIHKLVSLNKR